MDTWYVWGKTQQNLQLLDILECMLTLLTDPKNNNIKQVRGSILTATFHLIPQYSTIFHSIPPIICLANQKPGTLEPHASHYFLLPKWPIRHPPQATLCRDNHKLHGTQSKMHPARELNVN